MEEVYVVKMAKFRHNLHSLIRQVMKKYIAIEEEVLVRLLEGKYVEGSLHRDLWTGIITFNVYKRLSREPGYVRPKDRLVKKLPWGWVKESLERIKVFSSFPKDVGTARVMGLLEEHTRDAKCALIEREIIESV